MHCGACEVDPLCIMDCSRMIVNGLHFPITRGLPPFLINSFIIQIITNLYIPYNNRWPRKE